MKIIGFCLLGLLLLNPGHFSDFHQSVRDMLPLEKSVTVPDDSGQLATM